MGQVINALAFRLGVSRFWLNKISNENTLLEFVWTDSFRKYFEYILNQKFLKKRGLIYSHVILSTFFKKLNVELYIYDGKMEFFFLFLTSQSLVNKIVLKNLNVMQFDNEKKNLVKKKIKSKKKKKYIFFKRILRNNVYKS